MAKSSLVRVASILALVGGILMIVFSLIGLVGMSFMMRFGMSFPLFMGFDIVALILGIVAIIASKQAGNLVWAIVLIIIGLLDRGVGGILVLIAGILGLLSKYL